MPNYISRTPSGNYQFRIVIPAQLRCQFSNKREIRKSLRTDSRKTALIRARLLWVRYYEFFYGEVTDLARKRKKRNDSLDVGLSTYVDEYGDLCSVDIPEDRALEAQQISQGMKRKRQAIAENPDLLKLIRREAAKPNASAVTSIPFSQLAKKYLAYGEYKDKTRKDYSDVLALFIRINGDLLTDEISRPFAGDYFRNLKGWPTRANQKKFNGMSVTELFEFGKGNPDKCLTPSTIIKHLRVLKTVTSFGLNNGYCEFEPFAGVKIKDPVHPHDKRDPWSRDDLVTIFSHPRWRYEEYKTAIEYWLPLLGLFTGARRTELCQLLVSDVVQSKEGVWVFWINDEGEKSTKNRDSRRRTPVHSKLISLGFIDYVKSLPSDGCVFPGISAEVVGADFSRFKIHKLGFKDRYKKCFHSFRHLVASELQYCEVSEPVTQGVIGHSDTGDTATKRYVGKKFATDTLQRAIEKLVFDDELVSVKPYNPAVVQAALEAQQDKKPSNKRGDYATKRLAEILKTDGK